MRRLEIGLAARGCNGELRVLEPKLKLSWLRLSISLDIVGLIALASEWLAHKLSIWPYLY